MKTTSSDMQTPAASVPPLPRLSDDAVVEIRHFLEYVFDLFEARYGDQITRFYESLSRDNLLASGDPPF